MPTRWYHLKRKNQTLIWCLGSVLGSVFVCGLLLACFDLFTKEDLIGTALPMDQEDGKERATKKALVPETKAEEGSLFTSMHLWKAVEGRPAYGGQLFTHLLNVALKEKPDFKVFTSECTFKKPASTQQTITYQIVKDIPIGTSLADVFIEGYQPNKDGDPELVVYGKTSMARGSQRQHEEPVSLAAEDHLSEYFPRGLPDKEKMAQMLRPEEYVEKRFGTKGMTEERKTIYQKVVEADLRFLDLEGSKWKRCISFTRHPTSATNPSTSATKAKYIFLSFCSDAFLLETATMAVNEDITSKTLNILSVTHSVRFVDVDAFEMDQVFFFSITVHAVNNNTAYCTGNIIQNDRIIAYVSQNGVIRKKKL
ncbi:hypothetical protein NEDG_01750 [Nematocida displodere]|uniref:Acyl-CoA thioesterase 2 C-terminal domain-containing protein n=1 Tax=Nematocida displodere TaxID=1805483 RepID=A0A177EDZ7_9MICR|nr:hypothetical protein NEDG_01750 [Nematocida displodere]